MPKSKFYTITDLDALREFNPKAVKMVAVVDNGLVLRMLRDFEKVPGVTRNSEAGEAA